MSKQTAVNFLRDEAIKLVVQAMQGTLNEDTLEYQISQIVTKAMAMEREQIIDAYYEEKEYRFKEHGEQYYNETYGGQDE
jgi:hypothetical protein